MDKGETMVSFDVSPLFTNVPIGEATDIIRDRLEEDDSLEDRTPLSPHRVAELLQLCLRSTYFSFNGEFYEQKEGAAMGSPVSAVVANLYMEFFEELALRTAPARPRIWKRYVDDTFTLVKKGDVDELLVHLNSIRPSIKLTTELEEGGSIPFLDTRKVDGKLDVTVYRKPTHTDRYLHFSSHHPTHVKKGLVLPMPLRPRQEHHKGSFESGNREGPPLWCLAAEWLPGSLTQSSIAGKQASRTRPRRCTGRGQAYVDDAALCSRR